MWIMICVNSQFCERGDECARFSVPKEHRVDTPLECKRNVGAEGEVRLSLSMEGPRVSQR